MHVTYRKYDFDGFCLVFFKQTERNAQKWDGSSEIGREKSDKAKWKNKNSFIFDVWLMLPEIDVVRNRLC